MSRHPRGHFLTNRDLHILDDDQMKWYQDTGDEDLDGSDDFDDDKMISEDGYATMSPAFDESEMLEALEDPSPTEPQAELEPQEAYEAMKFQAPLSKEERAILTATPFLQEDPRGGNSAPIRWVDDADHFEWMHQRMKDRHKAMDEVLEDEMYGASMTEEEAMDRAGTEVGFKLRLRKPKIGKFVRKVGRGVRRAGAVVARPVSKLVKKFVPGRDAGKAKMVKGLNAKLVKEHTNFLMVSDRKRGIKKPRSAYGAVAKLWAKNQIQKAGLPTSYAAGSEVAGDILGVDCCGAWYNPFSWFSKKVKYVLVNTEGERLAEMTQTEYEAYAGTKAAQATQQPGEGEPPPEGEAPPEGAEAPPEEPPPEEPPPEEAAGDWKSVAAAFHQGKKAGESEFSPESESEGDLMGKYYRSIKDPLADIDGDIYVNAAGDIVRQSELSGDFVGDFVGQFVDGSVSRGAVEEALVEATGDADVGRRLGGLRRALGKVRGLRRGPKTPASPEAQALKVRIKAQIPSGIVSKALVQKWATARSGQPSGRKRRKYYKRMKHAINKRNAKVSKEKSETAGMGDFVGWA